MHTAITSWTCAIAGRLAWYYKKVVSLADTIVHIRYRAYSHIARLYSLVTYDEMLCDGRGDGKSNRALKVTRSHNAHLQMISLSSTLLIASLSSPTWHRIYMSFSIKLLLPQIQTTMVEEVVDDNRRGTHQQRVDSGEYWGFRGD